MKIIDFLSYLFGRKDNSTSFDNELNEWDYHLSNMRPPVKKTQSKKVLRSSIFKKMTRKGNNTTVVYTVWKEDYPFSSYQYQMEITVQSNKIAGVYPVIYQTGGSSIKEVFKNMRLVLANHRIALSYLPTKE